MESKDLAKEICRILSSKKAKDITIIDVHNLTIIADYFVIASATSTTAVRALAHELENKLLELHNRAPLRSEGVREGRWVAMDYGEVIVHIFYEETRKFYQLERLWTDGENATVYED
ncbi:MAG TPA: ribosome silencing factor [Clostridia bacterium]